MIVVIHFHRLYGHDVESWQQVDLLTERRNLWQNVEDVVARENVQNAAVAALADKVSVSAVNVVVQATALSVVAAEASSCGS